MRLWAILAAVLLSSLVLAGCSDDDEGGDATSSSSSSSSGRATTSSSATSTTSASTTTSQPPIPPPGEPDNAAPTGSMAVAIFGKAANFTLTGNDPDGDNIVWDLAFGDGQTASGTVLPANSNHTYAVGKFNATFTISDGRLQTTYNVTVITAAAGPVTLFVFTETATGPGNPLISLEIPGVGWCGAQCCPGFDSGMSGAGCVFAALPAGLDGKAFTATSDVGDVDLEFWAACDPAELFSLEDFRNAGPESGVVFEGSGCVVMWDNAVPPSAPTFPTFTFTVIG